MSITFVIVSKGNFGKIDGVVTSHWKSSQLTSS